MGGYEQRIEDLQCRIEFAESVAERQEALDELEILAELAHAEHDRELEAAARAAVGGVGG